MNLILFGFKGCGKTHFGKILAQKLNLPFVDLDDLIGELYAKETGENLSVRAIYHRLQEEGFRALESLAIDALSDLQNTIIALGGGAVLDPANVEKLQKIGELVYLDASPQTLRYRILRDELPAFLNDEYVFETMIQTRKPIYESIRARKINVDDLDAAAVIAALRNILILEEPHGE